MAAESDSQHLKRKRVPKKPPRGVFERAKGSGIWWICYVSEGRKYREKIGPNKTLAEMKVAAVTHTAPARNSRHAACPK